ncbi:hypothetical protein EHQ53_07065 [Leptospira langatensis]|uniref:Uncharacterized protein n=1 Tax=Leptospira langatensis TaxID=2484983 RepID=A0A5F1ZU30_9LEPT|nr:hypothetical protein [Leptospira langatensis]TGK03198.1 hypothetical protein EHO57_07895 [Leptospira langatensis]TGL41954.1 hypothetical protein EHQ53_07065 [Leptospira langatensis]
MNLGAIQSSVIERPRDTSVQYIGHGQLESSPQSTSVLHVISHELGHVAEFRNEAIRDNAELRSLEVSIHYEMRDGKLVAVAGETKATTVKKPEKDSSKGWELAEQSQSADKKPESAKNKEAENRSDLISDKEWELMSELREIDLELNRLDKGQVSNEDRERKTEDDARRHMELVERKRKLEMALSQEKLKALLDETLKTIQELNEKQIQFAGKVYYGDAINAAGNLIEAQA